MEEVYSKILEKEVDCNENESKISQTFAGATVFLTGATGFIGKLFMEKLLRSCPKLKMIYIVVRPKKGKDSEQRFKEIFDGPNMTPLKLKNPNYMDKVSMINGDCSLLDLGLEKDMKKKIIEECNFIIHCAATVKFDEKLKYATYINVRAVRELTTMAKQMKNLKAFLHVSTAFSHCVRKNIGEEFYKAGIDPDKLIDLVDAVDEDRLTNMTPGLLGEWPNTYAFTKSVAEEIIQREVSNLPIALLRPSIITSTMNEPIRGWIDNFYGPTGVVLGACLGVLRSFQGKGENVAELIPADFVVNAGLAIIWDVVEQRAAGNKKNHAPVYNVVSSPETPIIWDEFISLARKHGPSVPSELQVWHNYFSFRRNYYHNLLACFLLHTVPAYLVDFICKCLGKEPMMVKGYQKINKFMSVLAYFGMNKWNFENYNVQELWKKMSPEEQKLYFFSMKNFDWDEFFGFYLRGGRVYLLKDPLETIPKGRVKYWKLFVMHYTLIAVLFFIFVKFLFFLYSCIF